MGHRQQHRHRFQVKSLPVRVHAFQKSQLLLSQLLQPDYLVWRKLEAGHSACPKAFVERGGLLGRPAQQ